MDEIDAVVVDVGDYSLETVTLEWLSACISRLH